VSSIKARGGIVVCVAAVKKIVLRGDCEEILRSFELYFEFM
jgi:hypothetical protein